MGIGDLNKHIKPSHGPNLLYNFLQTHSSPLILFFKDIEVQQSAKMPAYYAQQSSCITHF